MIKYLDEIQKLCRDVMHEFRIVAEKKTIQISEEDIEDVMEYFLSYNEAKHTSMLEDVQNNRQTENEYIAGYIVRLAENYGVSVPRIEMLYRLMKIKEDVYLNNL